MSQQPPLRGDQTYRDEVIRVAELTVNTTMLDGLTFTNCRIIGPAILAFLDHVTVSHCTWDAPSLDAVFWEVPPERGPVVGIVGLTNCAFSNCTFENIGVAGPPQMRASFEAGGLK